MYPRFRADGNAVMTKKLTSAYGGIGKHMFWQTKQENCKMEINKKYARSTPSQLRLYVAYCKDHPELLQSKNCPTSRNQIQKIWEEITSKLNAMVGPTRTTDVWREGLRNWRKQLRSRARKIAAERRHKGGEQNSVTQLTDFEQEALEVFGVAAAECHSTSRLGSQELSECRKSSRRLKKEGLSDSTLPAYSDDGKPMPIKKPVKTEFPKDTMNMSDEDEDSNEPTVDNDVESDVEYPFDSIFYPCDKMEQGFTKQSRSSTPVKINHHQDPSKSQNETCCCNKLMKSLQARDERLFTQQESVITKLDQTLLLMTVVLEKINDKLDKL